jgi:hypothetical protein
MAIEAQDVARLIREAFPELRTQVDRHTADWPDDPMIYLIVGTLFQWAADMPVGRERVLVASRMYALTEKMLGEGSEQVRDCFSIEMIEPLMSETSTAHYPNFEAALGSFGRRDLAAKREWAVRYSAMNRLINALNGKLGGVVFEAVGIDGDTVRVIANPRLWKSASEARRTSMFQEIQGRWLELTGHEGGIEITEPRECSFRILRQS